MKTVSFKLPELLVEQITSLASKSGESRSSLVRKAIESLVHETHAQDRTSCLDLARDLAGAVAGPDDLSHDAAHLTSYGRSETGSSSAPVPL